MIRIGFNNFLFLPRRGWLIDVGCREFLLPKIAAKWGMKVIAVDPAPDISTPEGQNIFYEQLAIVGSRKDKTAEFYVTADKQTSYLEGAGISAAGKCGERKQPLERGEVVTVSAMTLEELLSKYGLDHVEVLKLNCEGSEEEILLNLKRPLAHQISVEFHRHLGFSGFTSEIRNHMGTWYDWLASAEDRPFERVIFYLKGDRRLYMFAMLAKAQLFLSFPFYAARKLFYKWVWDKNFAKRIRFYIKRRLGL